MPKKVNKKIKKGEVVSPEKKKRKEKKYMPTRPKYEHQQLTKIVNSYGGIGSVIQTRQGGSLLIEDFMKWPCQTKIMNKNRELYDTYKIKEDRLTSRLKREYFPRISGLFRIPQTECKYGMTRLEEPNSAISASFFPKYFYCPHCRRLKHLDNWQIGNNKGYPVCNCHNYIKKLEQVRFILVSESGNISDIPWLQFLHSTSNQISFQTPLEDTNRNMSYGTAASAESLAAITIHEKDSAGKVIKSKNLGTLPETTFIDQKGVEYKMQLRQSNSIFYIKTVSSIFIPEYVIPIDEQTWIDTTVKNWLEDGVIWNIDKLYERFKDNYQVSKTTENDILKYLTVTENDHEYLEDEYRMRELEYFLNPSEDPQIDPVIDEPLSIKLFMISNLYNIKKLRQTTVQTGYCRMNPEGPIVPIGNRGSLYYPAVEMKGEGILIEFDKDTLKKKINGGSHAFADFVHTFSHIIMKELEFECGYSVSTLKERLYCHFDSQDQPMHLGVMIYALSGSDGSMGGISSLFYNSDILEEKNIYKIIRNAIIRAKDCPNDPICYSEEDSSNRNAASCYACTLIPETSCEQYNKGLNRKLINEVLG